LFDIARRHPVSVARLVEAHTDAVAILRSAGRSPVPGTFYGVWASAGPSDDTRLEHHFDSATDWATTHQVISGTKPFASGLGVVSRALVTSRLATSDDAANVLVDVDVGPQRSIVADLTAWSTPALAESATGSVRFVEHPVASEDVIGPPGWYLDRVGFWHGACGPAACWAGAAAGLVDAAEQMGDDNPHRRAHLGAMRSDLWALRAVLDAAGREIDDDPHDRVNARQRALALRHHVERTATDILDRFGRAFGPRPFVHDVDLNQRWFDLHLYLRQDHAERDLAVLGEPCPPPHHG
jgi:alkylation response protein AidB-like acyl-CoA dehydrogenase